MEYEKIYINKFINKKIDSININTINNLLLEFSLNNKELSIEILDSYNIEFEISYTLIKDEKIFTKGYCLIKDLKEILTKLEYINLIEESKENVN